MKTRTIWLMPLLWGLMAFTCVSPGGDPERRARISDREKDTRDGVTVTLVVLIMMLLGHETHAWRKQ